MIKYMSYDFVKLLLFFFLYLTRTISLHNSIFRLLSAWSYIATLILYGNEQLQLLQASIWNFFQGTVRLLKIRNVFSIGFLFCSKRGPQTKLKNTCTTLCV